MSAKHDAMVAYIEAHNLQRFVRELVEGLGAVTEMAIEYVYDQHTMTDEEFIEKYFGKIGGTR